MYKEMKLTIVSNYINHHQIPLSNELYKKLAENFAFIQTEQMEKDRVLMGWGSELGDLPYLRIYDEDVKGCQQLIMDSDVVIFGGVEDERYIKPRLHAGKIVLRASERLYREGQWKSISPRGRRKKYIDHTQYANSEVYLLCHGAYVASDFNLVHAYPNKKYMWGYFPAVYMYDLEELFKKKQYVNDTGTREIRLLWAGRFMKLKHPEYAIKVAWYLARHKISFHLDMVGAGALESKLKKLTQQYKLEKYVTFHGFQPPRVVRQYMEEAEIFLFTSNYLEGWGAVLNEAMNSACAVVCGHGIGAVPFLLKHGTNGIVYKTGHFGEFCKQVLYLCREEEVRKKLGQGAYQTIVDTWNPIVAADRLMQFCTGLMEKKIVVQATGPLSIAPVIAPREGYRYTRT